MGKPRGNFKTNNRKRKKFVQKVGYKNWKETDNPAYKLFLGAEFN